MLQEISTRNITISPAAAQAVRDVLTEKHLDGYGLRVFVAGGGCCGVQFGMALDNVIRENDRTFRAEGINVIVDDMSIDYLTGASIEFVNDPEKGAGFVVNSPQARSGESCGCGGSCECGGHGQN